MHSKLINWLNLTAYLPVILLQVLNLLAVKGASMLLPGF